MFALVVTRKKHQILFCLQLQENVVFDPEEILHHTGFILLGTDTAIHFQALTVRYYFGVIYYIFFNKNDPEAQ